MKSSKMKLGSAWDFVSLGLVAGTLIISVLLEPSLPARIATHFDIHGAPNGWSSRAFGVWFMPLFSLAIWAFIRFAMLAAPESWRARAAAAPLPAAATATVAFLCGLQLITLRAALHGGIGLGRELALLIGAMWIALAVLLPRIRRNPILGVRTAWTLSSDENWARTHRVASYTFLAGGLLALAAGLTGVAAAATIALVAVIASALAPAAYSWAIARHT
ncbi:MAG: SdpI family protein [Polyangiaceae bacterium]